MIAGLEGVFDSFVVEIIVAHDLVTDLYLFAKEITFQPAIQVLIHDEVTICFDGKRLKLFEQFGFTFIPYIEVVRLVGIGYHILLYEQVFWPVLGQYVL